MKAVVLKFLQREPNRREKILFATTGILFAVFLVGGMIVKRGQEKAGLYRELKGLKIEEGNYRKLAGLNEKAKQHVSQTMSSVLSIDDVFHRLEKSARDDRAIENQQAFDWLASPQMRAGAKLLTLERGAEESTENYLAVPISLRMGGSPRQMVLYLEALEGLPQLLSIEVLKVSATAQGVMEWELKLDLYFGKKKNAQVTG